ncbi:MAG TPA: hypothetical protein VGX23_36240 [Actinocrinis sp.]|nr:hypothetical protein [Actinocrinis sp.]
MNRNVRPAAVAAAAAAGLLALALGSPADAASGPAAHTPAVASGPLTKPAHLAAPASHPGANAVRPQTPGGWISEGTEPVLYNENYWYVGSVINQPSNIPATSSITDVCFTWNYGLNSRYMWMELGNTQSVYDDTTGAENGCTTAFNGETADQPFEFGFAVPNFSVPSGTEPALNPPVYGSSEATVDISYS